MIFEIFISTHGIYLNLHYFSSQYFFDLEEMIFENFNISENNVINVELAKVLVYSTINMVHELNHTFLSRRNHCS
jgi:hypothetical protein